MTHDEIEALASQFFAAIEAGDIDTVAATYADDAVIWHNFDQVEQSKVDNLRTLAYVVRTVAGRSYDDVRRVVLDDGFVQQHVLRGSAAAGALEVPAMLRVWVADGRITRLDEYLDTAQVAVLTARSNRLTTSTWCVLGNRSSDDAVGQAVAVGQQRGVAGKRHRVAADQDQRAPRRSRPSARPLLRPGHGATGRR